MANYTGNLTEKQEEMLKPLEAEAKDIMKRKEKLRKLRAFKHSMGFEENKETKAEMDALEERHRELSKEISKIYNAQSEMVEHMKRAIAEMKIVEEFCKKYGFDVGGKI